MKISEAMHEPHLLLIIQTTGRRQGSGIGILEGENLVKFKSGYEKELQSVNGFTDRTMCSWMDDLGWSILGF